MKRIRLIQFCRLGYTGSTVAVKNLHIDKLFLSHFDSFTNWISRNEGFTAFKTEEANFSFFFLDVWLFLVVFDLSLSHIMSKWTVTFIKSARLALIKLDVFKVVFFLLVGRKELGVEGQFDLSFIFQELLIQCQYKTDLYLVFKKYNFWGFFRVKQWKRVIRCFLSLQRAFNHANFRCFLWLLIQISFLKIKLY